MDIDAGDSERKVTQERINFIDNLIPNPEVRAKKVFDVIERYNKDHEGYIKNVKIDNWDILCFCVSHLISLCNVYTWLQLPAKHLKFLVFNAHYLYPEGHGLIKK